MKLTVRGKTAYAATGNKRFDPEKQTVVFLHGVGQDHTVWVLPTRYFAGHDRNVLAVDLPGHGRSEGAPHQSVEEMADWVSELMDEAGVDEAAIAGHSMGSLVALDMAARHPDRVRVLVMVAVSIPLAVGDLLMKAAADDSHDAIEMLTYWGLSNAAQIGGNANPGMWMAGGGMRLWERAAHGTIHADLKACDDYVAGLDRAAEIICPALLLLGQRDRMTPVRAAKVLRETLAEQDTVIFEGAGHALLLERPDPVLDELIKVV